MIPQHMIKDLIRHLTMNLKHLFWSAIFWAELCSRYTIDCMEFKRSFSTSFLSYCGGLGYLCFPGVLFTSISRNILSKPLAAFPNNNCWNNGQRWDRNESCPNDYHQSSERILTKPSIEPATSCFFLSPVRFRLSYKGFSVFIKLTISLTSPGFTCLLYKSFENTKGKKRNCS